MNRLSGWWARVFRPTVVLDNRGANPTARNSDGSTAIATASIVEQQKKQLFDAITHFTDTVVREIMVPRTEVIALPMGSNLAEVSQLLLQAGHSRVPVYDDQLDNIIGIMYAKDLLKSVLDAAADGTTSTDFQLSKIVRAPFYVPEVMLITDLLREFQKRKTHLAIVVDEYAGTAGVVTLEDIIEEIVGEIQDEYDVEASQYRRLADNKWIADGRTNIWDLAKEIGAKFPSDSGFETVAGFLVWQFGCLPESGATIEWGNFKFVVKEADEKRISTVEIQICS